MRPDWAGFLSFLSHFPAMFWTAFLQTSYSPWGIVSAWRDWMIVLIHKGLDSDSKQGTQRKLHSQVKQWTQPKCGELCCLADFLASREECFPVVALKWNFPDSSPCVTIPRGHFLFLSLYLSPFRGVETFKPVTMDLQKRQDQVVLSLCWFPLWSNEE